jgi:hypothetical protein
MMPILLASSIVAMFLIVWFRSEAYVEYCRLLKIDFISHYKDYYAKRVNDVSLTYHDYLRQYHDSFCIRLITCPICMAAWLSMGVGLLFWSIALVPMIFIGGLILFGIVHNLLR